MKNGMFTLVLMASLMGCTRDQNTLGPNLSDLYGEFTVLEDFSANAASIDFSSGASLVFSARFSKTVDWEIHVVGQTSGAEKVLEGKSKVIDQTNGRWNGSTTHLPMFKAEGVTAILRVADEQFADTLAVSIVGTKVNDGFVVADFETGILPGWVIFKQSGADMSFNIVTNDSAPQAGHYYDMGGAVSWDYLIGLMHFPASAYQQSTYPLPANPSNVYFNVQLRKPQGITNEIVLFQFSEDENGDGQFQPASEDMYSIEMRNLPTDWEQFSFRYSELVSLVNGVPANPAGNGLREPDKLFQVSVLFLADPASGYSQTYLDYMIFTENQALEP